MNVGDYYDEYTYLKELEKYYYSTVKVHNFGKLVRICKEIDRLKQLLKLNKNGINRNN